MEKRRAAAKLSQEIVSKITPEEKRQIESDGGIDKNELNTVLLKSNIKPSAEITEKFNELDTNRNGKIEESEISSTTEGRESRIFPNLLPNLIPSIIQNLPGIIDVGSKILIGALG